jgi:D-arabinose 1-dehydrogenase-like Zn-dependent alcohol dehydrogenase
MAKMKTVEVSKPNGRFEVVEREVRDPGPAEIRVKVEACGICHSDALARRAAPARLALGACVRMHDERAGR